MSKVCGMEGCKKQPEMYCECTKDKYYCLHHFLIHVKRIGQNHISGSLFVLVNRDLRQNIIKGINARYQLLEKAKIELKKRCNETIEFAIKRYKIATKKLKDDQNYYNSIMKIMIQKSEVDKVEYESGYLTSEPLFDLSYSLDSIRMEINSCFNCDFLYHPPDEECFWLQGTNLYKINLDNYKKTQQNIQFSFGQYNNSCRLPDQKYFVQNCSSSDCYSIDLKLNTATQLPSMPPAGYMAAVGCIFDTVYVLCGYSTASNEAYNTVTRKWSKIAPCPVTWHANSGGVILNKMCITAYAENNAYIYDPKTNQYSAQMVIPGNNWKPVGHGYILTNQCMFQVQGNDITKWKNINYVSGAPNYNSYHGISNLFKKGKYLYAIDTSYQVWQIDTELYGAKLLVTT